MRGDTCLIYSVFSFQNFKLTEKDIHKLCLDAVEATFLPSSEKDTLRQLVKDDLSNLKGNLLPREKDSTLTQDLHTSMAPVEL